MNDLKYVLINLICFLMLSCGVVIHGADMGAGVGKSSTAYRIIAPTLPKTFQSAQQAAEIRAQQKARQGEWQHTVKNFEKESSVAGVPIPRSMPKLPFQYGVSRIGKKIGMKSTVEIFIDMFKRDTTPGKVEYAAFCQEVSDITVQNEQYQAWRQKKGNISENTVLRASSPVASTSMREPVATKPQDDEASGLLTTALEMNALRKQFLKMCPPATAGEIELNKFLDELATMLEKTRF